MSTILDIQTQVWDLLTRPSNAQNLKRTVSSFKEISAPSSKTITIQEPFSQFVEADMHRAKEIWTQFFELADNPQKTESEAMVDVINYYRELEISVDSEMLKYAFRVFKTHNDRAKRLLHGMDTGISKIQPFSLTPSSAKVFELSAGGEPAKELDYGGGTTSDKENLLNWYREDPLLNEHHEHWHVVYPNSGVQNSTKDRQGELFIYMHQQMIARYDTERLAYGLPRLEPYGDFNKPIEVGYNSGDFVKLFSETRYTDRGPNVMIKEMSPPRYYTIDQHTVIQKRVKEVVERGWLEIDNKKIKITADLIGLLIESISGSVGKFTETKLLYGNIHNNGHMLIANAGDNNWGVMSATATAVKDPVFWQWHKHIDEYSYWWQEQQAPNDFNDAPNVLIRKGYDWSPDIIFCDLDDWAETLRKTNLKDEELAQKAFVFGPNSQNRDISKWNMDFTESLTSVGFEMNDLAKPITVKSINSFKTFPKKGSLFIKGENQQPQFKVSYNYLSHQKFGYFIRLQNLSPFENKVTVRVFIVAKEQVEDRRMWIEMDKFIYTLKPDSKNIIFRRDVDSAVIKKPAVLDPDLESVDKIPLSISAEGFFPMDVVAFTRRQSDTVDELKGYLATYEQAKKDYEQTGNELTFRKEKASFRNVLSMYFTYASYGWEELYKIDFRGYNELKEKTDKSFHQLKSSQISESAETFHSSFQIFLTDLIDLLNWAKDGLANELKNAISNSYYRVYNLSYCECGLPYHLLLPKGTAAGMEFYFMVMVTDWKKDIVGEENCCGSMSYCGAKDRYPDVREMGYPFNRPLANGILNTISRQANMACRTIIINFEEGDGIKG